MVYGLTLRIRNHVCIPTTNIGKLKREAEELTSLVVWNFRFAIFDSELILIESQLEGADGTPTHPWTAVRCSRVITLLGKYLRQRDWLLGRDWWGGDGSITEITTWPSEDGELTKSNCCDLYLGRYRRPERNYETIMIGRKPAIYSD